MVLTGITGEIGEFLVKEKLEKITNHKWKNHGNKADWDLEGKNYSGKELKIQVKATSGGMWSLDSQKYLKFNHKVHEKEIEQIILGINDEYQNKVHFFVFVYLDGFKESNICPEITKNSIKIYFNEYTPEYFIIKTEDLQNLIKEHHSQWLEENYVLGENKGKKHNVRKSHHFGLRKEYIEKFKDKWESIN